MLHGGETQEETIGSFNAARLWVSFGGASVELILIPEM